MSVSKIILSLMQLADEDTAAGKSDEAIFDVRAAVRYAGALHADDRFNRTGIYSSAQDNSLYQRLQTWVRRSDMTSELVQRTLADLDKYELRWWLTDPMTLEAAYQDDLKDLDRIGATMGVRRWLVAPWLARQRRLNACKLSNRLRFLRTPPTGSQFGGITPGADSDAVWNFQSPLQPVYYTTDAAGLPVGLAPEVIAALRDRETRIRCTFAMMAAEAYRKQHGQLPSDLHQVTPQIASRELLTDPWSGAPLQIRTQGVPGEILETSNSQRITEIQPGTPFVWSVGPFGYQLQPAAYPAALHSGTFRFIPTRHAMVYVSRMPLYIYPLSPDPKSADENGQPADALHPAGAQAEESLGGVLYALPRDVDDDR